MKKKKQPRNKFEKKLFQQLSDIGIKFEYEPERIPYVRHHQYIPDYKLFTPLGIIYVEAKGYFRPEHRAKLIAVKQQHPNLDIRIVLYRSSKKDTKWCEKNGFIYAINNIPDVWLEGKW